MTVKRDNADQVKNVGQSEKQQMFTLSDQGKEEERSQMIGWDPKTEVGTPSCQRK